MGRQGGGGDWSVLLVIVMCAAVLVIVVFWLIAILTITGSILWWLVDIWHDDQPGEIGYHLKRWLVPRWHYPFVGVGSVIASVAGADAMHEIVKGANPAIPILILAIVLARSVSMAWWPWPRTRPVGLHVYPWVAVTGPLASALGMAAVWVLVIGGQITGPVHSHQYWVALSCAPFAILIVLIATAVGRAGRILVPRSAPTRTDMSTVLDLAGSSEEMDLPRTPPPPRSHCTRLIPPIGPPDGPWAAVRPSLLLNWKRLLWVPIGAVVGAGAGYLMVVVYSAGSPLPGAVSVLFAMWIWLAQLVGPMLFTFLYIDGDWVGERGLWWRRGVSTAHCRWVISATHGVDLIGRETGATGALHAPQRARLRLKWSEQNVGPVVRRSRPTRTSDLEERASG